MAVRVAGPATVPTAPRDGVALADLVVEQIRTWNTGFRDRTLRIALPDTPGSADPAVGRFVLERPNHPITITWE